MSEIAYVGIGSNLGDRLEFMRQALDDLGQHEGIDIALRSSVYESPALNREQPDYLNTATSVQTDLAPAELMKALLSIEKRLGRIRETKWGPRTIDLDVLLFGDLVLAEPGLVVPHPRMLERGFVLLPLCEINPLLQYPVDGRPLAEYALACDDGTRRSSSFRLS
jgi:2-amino-4-hydroxy-6-hydroxymethyldihydropteridine diphosphokinase